MQGRKQLDGRSAEDQAQRYLVRQGLTLVTRNYRCKAGEIDLVMQDGDTLVFVEVRLRRNRHFGGALASVDTRKQRHLVHAAQHYLQYSRWTGPCRFDVLGMDGRGDNDWIRDAFAAG